MDVIELRGLRTLCICGALPEEQARAQPLELDLDLELDLGDAAATDDLDRTVDYSMVLERVSHLLAAERFVLLERLAERVAEEVLADLRVQRVHVAVRKLRPPVPQQVATTGVRIVRGR